MKRFGVIYFLIGVILVTATFATGEYGLSKVNRSIYEKACEAEKNVAQIQFPNFHVSDYKVRFYNDHHDYVVQGDSVKKEQPVFDTFVGSTLKVNGEQQVIVPEYELFAELFHVAGTAQSMAEGTMAFSENTYTEHSHIATICHEAFHAWQFSNWEQEIEALTKDIETVGETNRETAIVNHIDSNDTCVVLLEKEMELLQEAYQCQDDVGKRSMVMEALDVHAQRQQELSAGLAALETYLENLEGSAMYVEAMVYRSLEGEEAFWDYYMGDFVYSNGSAKYYTMGMLKCMLLDTLFPNWKESWNLEETLDVLLDKVCRQNI